MTDLPWLLLDVDGVLLPLGAGDGEEMVESSDEGHPGSQKRRRPQNASHVA